MRRRTSIFWSDKNGGDIATAPSVCDEDAEESKQPAAEASTQEADKEGGIDKPEEEAGNDKPAEEQIVQVNASGGTPRSNKRKRDNVQGTSTSNTSVS